MGNNENKTIKDYIRTLKTGKWLFLEVFFLTVASAATFSLLWPPTYDSTATILLDYSSSNPLEGTGINYNDRLSAEYMLNEKSIVESNSVAMTVIEKLHMDKNPIFIRAYEKSKESFLKKLSFLKKKTKRKTREIHEWLLDFLSNHLTVTSKPNSRIFEITFTSNDPYLSAEIANTFAWAYNKHHLELKVSSLKETESWISGKLEQLRKDAEEKEKVLEEHKAKRGIINPQNYYSITSRKIEKLSTNLVDAEASLYEMSMKADHLNELKRKKGNYESLPEVISNAFIQKLKIEAITLEKTMSELSKRVGVNHPQYRMMLAELETIKEKMSSEIENIVAAIKNDYMIASKRVENLKNELEKLQNEIVKINKETFDISMFDLEAKTAKGIYDALLTKFNEISLRGDINRTNIIVIDKAVSPTQQTSPNIMINLALSIFIGFFLGVGMVFAADSMDNTLNEERDIEIDFGVTVLGVIPNK